jgi:hypothetical protein
MTVTPATTDVRRISRRLRDLAEPIAAHVYFAPEAMENYEKLGLDYLSGYFCSRSASMGRLRGETVAAIFGVFNPKIVVRSVEAGWENTDPDAVLAARLDGATRALRRMLGEPDTARAVEILRPVMESQPHAGRPIFSGLRSLPFPDEESAQLWRVCDYVREHRGDGHNAAWTAAACDPVEITLLTELAWKIPLRSYAPTRGWSDERLGEAVARLEAKGYVRGDAFTDEGRHYRRRIESMTDDAEAGVVEALGPHADELFELLEPLAKGVLEAGGYPVGRLAGAGSENDD